MEWCTASTGSITSNSFTGKPQATASALSSRLRLAGKQIACSLLLLSAVAALAQEPTQTSDAPAPQVQTFGPRANRVPQGVTAHRDLAYVTSGHDRQKLDLYVPDQPDGPLPLIIWVHGGGWAAGSKDGCPPLRGGYTRRGYAVASIGYRLSGDAIFPAQIEDCKAAIRWLRAHAKEYNLDPDHFAAWGSSAGGHLVALLGTSGNRQDIRRWRTS